MILAFLYESLGESVDLIKSYEVGASLLFVGPFWFLQLWLNATFEDFLPSKGVFDENDDFIRNRTVEGTRLALLIPPEEPRQLPSVFKSFMMMFAMRSTFVPSMAPFVSRRNGPSWFTREFPPSNPDQHEESIAIWKAFLTPRILFHKLRKVKSHYGLLSYQPNLVAR